MARSKSSDADAGPPRLMRSEPEFLAQIGNAIERGKALVARPLSDQTSLDDASAEHKRWQEFVDTLLQSSFSNDQFRMAFRTTGGPWKMGPVVPGVRARELQRDVKAEVSSLESLRDRLHLLPREHPAGGARAPDTAPVGDRVFIVHGHNDALKLAVARFVERVHGTPPVILHEQADRGQTIIQKFEHHAEQVGFSIVLLTGDDEGRSVHADALQRRARQNVVLELGFFIGVLGRERVAVLCDSGVELPSDIDGLLYTPITSDGSWQLKLAREMKAAGLAIDFNKAL